MQIKCINIVLLFYVYWIIYYYNKYNVVRIKCNKYKIKLLSTDIVNWVAYVTMYVHNKITAGSMTNPHNCSSLPILPQNNTTHVFIFCSIVTIILLFQWMRKGLSYCHKIRWFNVVQHCIPLFKFSGINYQLDIQLNDYCWYCRKRFISDIYIVIAYYDHQINFHIDTHLLYKTFILIKEV